MCLTQLAVFDEQKTKKYIGYKLEQVPVVLTPTEVSLILQIEEKNNKTNW